MIRAEATGDVDRLTETVSATASGPVSFPPMSAQIQVGEPEAGERGFSGNKGCPECGHERGPGKGRLVRALETTFPGIRLRTACPMTYLDFDMDDERCTCKAPYHS